jgi:ubiquitin-associated SH3 domain-containing protein
MPHNMPLRSDKRDYVNDSPITEIGKFQARLTGEALAEQGFRFSYCYVSPSLRCIQTADQILKAQGIDKHVKIRIEASIFENTSLYASGLPKFLTKEFLYRNGFNIDMSYRPVIPSDRLKPKESLANYYNRSYNISRLIVNQHEREGGNVLVVGHQATLEACTRQITGGMIRLAKEFNAVVARIPFLGICMIEKDFQVNPHKYKIKPTGIPPLAHHSNINFDAASVL